DLIALLPGKALLLRVIHKGYRIYGHDQDSTWRVTDNASSLIVKNPVRALKESEAVFKETLAKEGTPHVQVETIAVFADNYAEPSFFTEEDVLPHLASTQTLKKEVQRIVKEKMTPVPEGLKKSCLKHYVPADEG
ncbi:NERD domain-containing protein, partial [Acidaminococcus sp.]